MAELHTIDPLVRRIMDALFVLGLLSFIHVLWIPETHLARPQLVGLLAGDPGLRHRPRARFFRRRLVGGRLGCYGRGGLPFEGIARRLLISHIGISSHIRIIASPG